MRLTLVDWAVVGLYFAFNLAIGFYYKARAGSSVNEFFLSGRNVPWWLAGLSMVATTFSSDTPNWVTQQVRQYGVAGNWQWWAFVLTGVSTVFFFARLWRRANVMTDVELAEVRWVDRAVVRAVLNGDQSQGFWLPPSIAIAHHLLKAWSDG